MLELECQQYFIDLPSERFLGRKIHIARHLHGDGGRPLALDLAEVGQRGPHHALVVNAAVFEEARVLNGEDCILHNVGNFIDWRQISAFFSEFA
ncbi:hypothetical protein SDC9_80192 [bioreactor metagenome]|uniref:Uncharacterized protein n=1 Tax=bioreactor metagenome TaxID=1076179 RepID=A0A644YYC1_9ZZZZ